MKLYVAAYMLSLSMSYRRGPSSAFTLLNFPLTAGNLTVGHYFPSQLGQMFGGADFLFG